MRNLVIIWKWDDHYIKNDYEIFTTSKKSDKVIAIKEKLLQDNICQILKKENITGSDTLILYHDNTNAKYYKGISLKGFSEDVIFGFHGGPQKQDPVYYAEQEKLGLLGGGNEYFQTQGKNPAIINGKLNQSCFDYVWEKYINIIPIEPVQELNKKITRSSKLEYNKEEVEQLFSNDEKIKNIKIKEELSKITKEHFTKQELNNFLDRKIIELYK